MSLALRLIDEPAARAIAAGRCPPGFDCVADYPGEGDRIAAGLFLQQLEAGFDPRPFGVFAVVLREPERELTIGGIGFHSGLDAEGRVEIGYGIAPSRQGFGYATQALRLLVEQAYRLGASQLLAETDHENAASRRVLERNGFDYVAADEHGVRLVRALGVG